MIITVDPKLKEIPVLFLEASNLNIKKRDRKLEKSIKGVLAEAVDLDDRRRRILEGYRELHASFGGKIWTPAPQHLYEFLAVHGRLMQINALVDIYNYISVKYALALGAHDLDRVEGEVAFKLTRGDEDFYPLGSDEPDPVRPGEYAYMDEREILCRLEVKQCEKTKITPETTHCFFIIQGNAATSRDYLNQAAEELAGLVTSRCQGSVAPVDVRLESRESLACTASIHNNIV